MSNCIPVIYKCLISQAINLGVNFPALPLTQVLKKYIILRFLITDDELSLDHEQHFICTSYTESLNLHQQLDARAALIS